MTFRCFTVPDLSFFAGKRWFYYSIGITSRSWSSTWSKQSGPSHTMYPDLSNTLHGSVCSSTQEDSSRKWYKSLFYAFSHDNWVTFQSWLQIRLFRILAPEWSHILRWNISVNWIMHFLFVDVKTLIRCFNANGGPRDSPSRQLLGELPLT
jgi:hypothetical protein